MVIRRTAFGIFGFGIGVVIALVMLELLMRLLPVNLGNLGTRNTTLWPMHGFEANAPFVYSHGWEMQNVRFGETNNYGQAAPFNFKANVRPVVVVGDSYIESRMNDYSETIQAQLARLSGVNDTYGFGLGGLALSDYLALSNQLRSEFAPRAAVFLITDGDVTESLIPMTGRHYFRINNGVVQTYYDPYIPGLLRYLRPLVGEIALLRYLQNNLRFTVQNLRKRLGSKPEGNQKDRTDSENHHRLAIDFFLANLAQELGVSPACTALLIDTEESRLALYEKSDIVQLTTDSENTRHYLLTRAKQLGFQIVDLRKVFTTAYQRSNAQFDRWPVDLHFNGRGHRIAAEQAFAALQNSGGDCFR